ncbi:MAG TPA: cardiolipin synthase [Bacteroidales bacterium]|nr:cardiolipin synthase [Bacteroidales bacterium]
MDADTASSIFSLQVILSLLYIITIIFVCMVIIFENRDPVKTLSWVLVITLIPFVGIILYFFFGQNYRKRKIFSRKGITDSEHFLNTAIQQIESLNDKLIIRSPGIKSKQHLMTLMLNNERSVLTDNNKILILNDAEETYPAMIKEIESAKHHIHFEIYRFNIDETGNKFRDILIRKAAEGVEVRMIIDDVGSWSFKNRYINGMRRAGVQIFPFFPVRFPWLASKINYRNHRKILVIDGKTGFIGGMNIADKYIHGLPGIGKWRDTHLKIRGDAVAGMNKVFLTDWYFLSGEILTGNKEYFPKQRIKGESWIQLASSGPDSDWATIMQAYLAAIATANERVYLCTPYFSPNESILNALKTAALSGKDVRLIIPEKSDSIIANWNSRSYVSELLHAGVRVYMYVSGFNHSKYIVVDGVFSSVGSVNVDMRSFDLDFEVTALIYDEEFANKLENIFMNDLRNSKELLFDLWEGRSKKEKYKESLARIFGPLY